MQPYNPHKAYQSRFSDGFYSTSEGSPYQPLQQCFVFDKDREKEKDKEKDEKEKEEQEKETEKLLGHISYDYSSCAFPHGHSP